MAEINLGAIKFNWKGTYSGGTAYVVDDVVYYNGTSYVCKLASTGNLPTNTTYWDVMAEGGDVATVLTTQGDILYRDGSGLQRLAAGTAGQVLKTGGSGANVSWVDQAGGHLVSFHNDVDQSNETTTASGYQTTASSITLTPASTASKFFILATFQGGNNTAARRSYYRIFYAGSELSNSAMNHEFTGATSTENPCALSVYHHPNTTSSITYDIRFHANGGGDEAKINYKNLSIWEFAS
tara:strand:- start:548 stop:1264 length:717 start_codon:yes stop_codon:yes gene_type:complete